MSANRLLTTVFYLRRNAHRRSDCRLHFHARSSHDCGLDIRPRLLSTGGVAQVAVLGGDIKEYQIQLDPERMRHYGISMGEVMAVTQDMNLNANGGAL